MPSKQVTSRIHSPRVGGLQQHLPTSCGIQVALSITEEVPIILVDGTDEAWIRSSASMASASSTSSSDMRWRPNPRHRLKEATPSWTESSSLKPGSGRMLAESIKACSDWHLLRALFLSIDKSEVNQIHITSALARTSAAARLSPSMTQQELKDLSTFFNHTLLQMATRLLPDMGSRELSSSLHSIANLFKSPSGFPQLSSTSLAKHFDPWIDACTFLIRSKGLRSPRDLSSVIWSLGILLPLLRQHCTQKKEDHSISLIQEALASSSLCLRSFNAQDLSTMLVGLERLSTLGPGFVKINDKLWQGLLDQTLYLMSAPVTGHKDKISQSWSNILHSIDQIGINPGQRWLKSFAKLSVIFSSHCSGQSLATLSCSFGKLWSGCSEPSESPLEVREWSECLLQEVISRLCSESGMGRRLTLS